MNDDFSSTPPSAAPVTQIDSLIALGPEKLTGIAAAMLVVIGFFAPDAAAQTGGIFGGTSEISFNLTQAGFAGVLVLLIGVGLGLSPFYLKPQKRSNVLAFGLSCAIFGTLAIAWLASLSLPAMISAVGHLGEGFYALLVGYGLNVYMMAKRVLTTI